MIGSFKASNTNVYSCNKGTTEKGDILEALNRSVAIIEFKMDGTILTANANFLAVMGYTLDEIKGKHHSMFADPVFASSIEYKKFWDSLKQGEFQSAEYKRFGKAGKEVWIEASYNPVLDKNGRAYKVIKFATDITSKKLVGAENQGKIDAIKRSQAVIEFSMDGTILDANANFLAVMGYTLDEIKGKHHSMFADPIFAASREYTAFWEDLRAGKFQAAQYKRLGKGGKEVWIEASYNPIFDMDGKPFKVIKFATDLTPRKEENKKLADAFEANFQRLVQTVASSATEMETTAQGLAAAADETSRQSNTVAAATEELSVSVNEISSQVVTSVDVVNHAVEEARNTEVLVSNLIKAADKIGAVAEIISEIADQTNLLALNATIEAARAGEAGKGFAVVASEVKALATETAKATEEIRSQVLSVQEVSKTAASAIQNIGQVIGKVSEISTTISGAVEEQSAATLEVSSNISGVQASANQTGESSATMLEVAKDLSKQSEELQGRVIEFLNNVRSM